MVDIRINYETLFDLLRREKNREELQSLDKDFYEQVLAYLKEKKDSLSKKDDELFASAEKEKLKIQFQNIRRIIKELYERREKKVINMAMSRARTGSDVIDTSALLPSEKEYFDDQVRLFVQYKDKVLDRILNVKEFDNRVEEKAVEAAKPVEKRQETNEETQKTFVAAGATETSKQKLAVPEIQKSMISESKTDSFGKQSFSEKKKVLIIDSMPRFMGLNNEVLGPFNEGEEVELDSQIADILVKGGKAEISG
jgi:DNA replication initiation complex subunit (GINS family)